MLSKLIARSAQFAQPTTGGNASLTLGKINLTADRRSGEGETVPHASEFKFPGDAAWAMPSKTHAQPFNAPVSSDLAI